MKTRLIATACDSKYFPALMALLRSLKRTNPDIPVIVFDGGLSDFQVRKVSAFASIKRREPFVSIVGRGKFSYVSDTSLLKLEAASLDCDKVISLDADTIVMGSLEPLFSFPEGMVGVVPETNAVKHMFRLKDRGILERGIKIDWEKSGFNAGVFALRPGEWPDLKERALSLVERFGADVFSKSKDQQLLNVIFSGRTYFFPRRYNFSPLYDEGAVESPLVIHYLTERKPWHGGYPEGCRYEEFRRNISFLDHPLVIGVDILRKMKKVVFAVPER